jgi:hypothetical protein
METHPVSETSCFSSNYLESGRWTKSEIPVILNTICSQYKGLSESVLVIQNVRLPGKRNGSNFMEIRLQKISRTPFMYTTCECRITQSIGELIAQ